MNHAQIEASEAGFELEYEFDDPPHKVWRAISVAAFRETWFPQEALADPEAISITPGREVRYRMRDGAPPFFESTVTFQISPNDDGGTRLRIIHELADARFARTTTASANDNSAIARAA